MKKSISVLLLLCLLIGMFGGVSAFAVEGEELAEAAVEETAVEETAVEETATEEIEEESVEEPAEEVSTEEVSATEESAENDASEEPAEVEETVTEDPSEDSGAAWTAFGTDCRYKIETVGEEVILTIAPAEGKAAGTLPSLANSRDWPWYSQSETITSVKFESGVKAGESLSYIFYNFSSLATIDLAGIDTSNATKMDGFFMNCAALESVDLSGFETGNVTTLSAMFYGCSSLKELDLSSFDTRKVQSMANMFTNCSSLETLDLTSFNAGETITMGNIFYGCTKFNAETRVDYINALLATNNGKCTDYFGGLFAGCTDSTIDLSTIDSTGITNLTSTFKDCTNLTELDLSTLDTKNVVYMSGTFWNCSKLSKLDLSGFNTQSLESIIYLVQDCSNLTEVDFSGWDTTKLMNLQYVFKNCTKLTTVDLSSFDTQNVIATSNMFEGCSALETIYVGDGWDTGSVQYDPQMFKDCTSLKGGAGTLFDSAKVDKTYAHIDGGTENPGYFTYQPNPGNPLTFTAEEANSSVTLGYNSGSDVMYKLNDGVWTAYTKGTTIDLPKVGDKVSFIGTNVKTDFFGGHFSMTGKIAASGSVTSLTDGDGSDPNVTLSAYCYSEMFNACDSLTQAPELPAVTLAEGCYYYMFSFCSSLTEAPQLPAVNLAKNCCTGMFTSCTSLVAAPSLSATTLEYGCYSRMFERCTSLTQAPELSAVNLADYCCSFMFAQCTSLTALPTLSAATMQKGCYLSMFSGCSQFVVQADETGSLTLSASTAENCYKEMFSDTVGDVVTPTAGKYAVTLAPCSVTAGEETTYYASLEEAVNAAKSSGGTVTLMDDVTLTAPVLLLNGDVVLDLNGHSVDCESDSGDAYAVILSGSANLTIQDSSADNSGAINCKSSQGYAQPVTMNGTGALKVLGGSLNSETTGDYNAVAIQMNEKSTVEISGNAVVSAKAQAAYASGIFDAASGKITVSGGKVSAYTGAQYVMANGIESYTASTITVSGGTVEASAVEGNTNCYGLACYCDGEDAATVIVTGGTIRGNIGVEAYDNVNLTISGTPSIIGEKVLGEYCFDVTFGGNTFDFSGYQGESLGNVHIYNGEVIGSLSKFGEDSILYGGSFADDPSAFLSEECVVTLNPDTGKYDVTVMEPAILDGAQQTVDLNKAGVSLTVRCNTPISCYFETLVDGETVDEKYCTVTEGSTIVTLSNDFLETLKAGKHTLTVVTALGDAETTFTIQEVNEAKPPKSQPTTPATGDDSGLGLWIVLTGVSVLALGAVLTLKRKEN